MYDPEESFAANASFDEIVERVNLFTERMLSLAGDDAAMLGEKLKQCVELLRRKYNDYLNEFDPDKKAQLAYDWRAKAKELTDLLREMAGNL
jgi:hypothetical protein